MAAAGCHGYGHDELRLQVDEQGQVEQFTVMHVTPGLQGRMEYRAVMAARLLRTFREY